MRVSYLCCIFKKDLFVLLVQFPWISRGKVQLQMQLCQQQTPAKHKLFRCVQSDHINSMSIEIQKFSSVGFESAFVALNVQCSLLGSRQFERKTCLWTLCCISGKNLALRIFWWFYSLTVENLYFSGKGAHIVILRNHWSINNFHLLFPTCI